jgi:hypothetical protein
LLTKKKIKPTKRGRGKQNEKYLNIFSTNAAGLKINCTASKMD